MKIPPSILRLRRTQILSTYNSSKSYHTKAPRTIYLAEYLWKRLKHVGLGSVHGVPGDYNLNLLDYLKYSGINWVGNANELNSGYAADGYARVKGIGALVTSFGVGELSAINAVACAYAEKAPVVHIVGTPPRTAQAVGACLHHSLGDGNFRAFANMYKTITVAQANLTDAVTAPEMIDAALRQCIHRNRPIYIEVPSDMAEAEVLNPESALDLSIPRYDPIFEDEVVDTIMSRLEASERPMILVDAFASGFGIKDEVNELAKITGIPTMTGPSGKAIVSEHLPNFHGVQFGSAGGPIHQAWADSRDLVLRFGALDADTNTFGHTSTPDPLVTVNLDKHSIEMVGGVDSGKRAICVKSVLNKLLQRIKTTQLPTPEPYPEQLPSSISRLETLPTPEKDANVDQHSFWFLVSDFLKEGDIVMTEGGTSSFGGHDLILPDNTSFFNSTLWLSTGHMLPSAQGASLALRDMKNEGTGPAGRTILFEGEGSLQMTAQSISDMIRNKLDVTIFVLNNKGYTIERMIHGFHETYNDIQPWRHLEAVNYFGASRNDLDYPVRTYLAETWGELRSVLESSELKEGKGLNMIEIKMDIGDAPRSLRAFVPFLNKRNGGAALQSDSPGRLL